MPAVIDSDEHLYEPRSMWLDNIDPSMRDEALRLEDDERGFTWLTWRGGRIELADAHRPGDTAANGRHCQRLRAGERSDYVYDEAVPDVYWSPVEHTNDRLAALLMARHGAEQSRLRVQSFPNLDMNLR